MEEAATDAALDGDECPSLDTDVETDVVVLGGGYTGLWTAWFLKERAPSIDVVLLEQDICGGLWEDLPLLVRTLGDRRAVRTAQIAERSIEEIEAWCKSNRVDAWFTR